MKKITTLLPEPLRQKHAKNRDLGCGNFLHVAAKTSPFADKKHFYMNRPCTTFLGKTYDSFSLNELRSVVDVYASWYYGVGVRAKDPVAIYVGEGL